MKAAKIASGLALATMLLSGSAALAQTSSSSLDTSTGASSVDSTSSSSVPGAPNTGTGGDGATTALLVGVAALIALGGIAYLARNTMTER